MEKMYYKKLLRNNQKIDYKDYVETLSKAYNSNPTYLNIKNKSDNEFIIFLDPLNNQIKEYDKTNILCIKLRDSSFENYFNKFLISEINSSLKIEQVNSTRRIVEETIKNKNKESKKQVNIKTLILNMDSAMNFILNTNDININNVFVLYSILTKDIKLKENALEKMSFYRKDEVTIGNDKGLTWQKIPQKMNSLINFINSQLFNETPIIKALIAHYIFAHIHPYYDFNGRMSRMVHLWILKKINPDELWKNIYLSESIFAFKEKFYKAFNKMNNAKELNIDLTLWISYLLDIFIEHNKAYIKMKKISDQSKVRLNDKARLFLIEMIIKMENNSKKWFSKKDFQNLYPDYSKTIADRVMKSLKDSKLFEIRISNINEYKLKNKFLNQMLVI